MGGQQRLQAARTRGGGWRAAVDGRRAMVSRIVGDGTPSGRLQRRPFGSPWTAVGRGMATGSPKAQATTVVTSRHPASSPAGLAKRIIPVILVALALATSQPQRTAADSAHGMPRASGLAPGLIVIPTVNHQDPAILWDPIAHLYRMYATNDWADGSVPESISYKVTGPWVDVGNILPTLPSWALG